MKPCFIFLCFTVLFAPSSCKQDEDPRVHVNAIDKLIFKAGGCFGTCPILGIEIDSSLKYKFHGVRNTEKEGLYLGMANKAFWDSLNLKLENINFKALDTVYAIA